MKNLKKLFSVFILTLAAAAVLCSCSGGEKQSLKVYNAGEYIDTALLGKFEKEFNAKVIYETFDSNESMYTKVASGEQYDVIIPSDYMIERLIKEDMLLEIDKTKLKNLDGIKKEVMDLSFDPGNKYSVPYFWGTVGILYNKNVVDKKDLETEGWNILKDTKYKGDIFMYDSERDSFMVALKSLGYSLNTENTAEFDEAYKWLVDQKNTMDPIIVGDDVIDNMISGNKSMAIVYSGDAAYIMSENGDMEYFEPKEGTNFWVDGMVIQKGSKQVDLAHSFIDFMIREDNAEANSEKVGYSSSVEEAFNKMKEGTYKGISAYTPRTKYEKDEDFGYQKPEIKKYSAELWTKVKSQQ